MRVKLLILSVKTAANRCNNATFQLLPWTKWEVRLKLSFLVTILHKKATNWTSNRIVIVKRKYIFEGETSPLHEMSVFPNAIFQDDGGS